MRKKRKWKQVNEKEAADPPTQPKFVAREKKTIAKILRAVTDWLIYRQREGATNGQREGQRDQSEWKENTNEIRRSVFKSQWRSKWRQKVSKKIRWSWRQVVTRERWLSFSFSFLSSFFSFVDRQWRRRHQMIMIIQNEFNKRKWTSITKKSFQKPPKAHFPLLL